VSLSDILYPSLGASGQGDQITSSFTFVQDKFWILDSGEKKMHWENLPAILDFFFWQFKIETCTELSRSIQNPK
jgi:hypothetical protein